MRADSAEPLIFIAWVREAVRAIYRDDLGAAFDRYFDTRALRLIRLLEGHATSRDWCDDRTTPERETLRGDDWPRPSMRALADLEKRYGKDRAHGAGALRTIAFGEHRPFGLVPGSPTSSMSRCRAPAAPTRSTAARWISARSRRSPTAHASSYRAIYDFADLERSLYIQTTGQSGNPFSPYYRSFAERWAKVEYIEIPTRREAIHQGAARHLERSTPQ